MENLETSIVPVKQGLRVPLLVVIGLLILFSAASAFVSLKLFGVKIVRFDETPPLHESSPSSSYSVFKFTPLPQSKFKSFPILQDEEKKTLTLFPLDKSNGDPIKVDTEVTRGREALYYGVSYPLPSPDLNTVAYIKNDRLWLVSADGSKKVRVMDNLFVSFLSGWSPDSRYLIVNSEENNINVMFMGMGIEDNRQFEKEVLPGGVYLVDTQKGKVTWLSPIKNLVTWIDSVRVITANEMNSPTPSYVVFDVEKFAADTKILRETFRGYFATQFSTSNASGKWALALGKPGGSSGQAGFGKIVLADFPQTEGKVIDEGGWAFVQWPILASDGKRLLYEKREDPNVPVVYYWDGAKSQKLVEGFQPMWVDKDRFIFHREKDQVFLYNLGTSQSTALN